MAGFPDNLMEIFGMYRIDADHDPRPTEPTEPPPPTLGPGMKAIYDSIQYDSIPDLVWTLEAFRKEAKKEIRGCEELKYALATYLDLIPEFKAVEAKTEEAFRIISNAFEEAKPKEED